MTTANAYNARRLARLILPAQSDKEETRPALAADLGTSVINLLFSNSESPFEMEGFLPSKSAQLSYFNGDIEKAVWVADKTQDVDVLIKFAKHRSVQVRRAVAKNVLTPAETREYLRAWAIKHNDEYTLNNLARTEPLLPLMNKMVTTSEEGIFEFYQAVRVSGLDAKIIASRLREEGDETLARLALRSPDLSWRAAAIYLAYNAKAGSLTLTEAVTLAETQLIPEGQTINSYSSIYMELRNLVDDAAQVITGELLTLADPRANNKRNRPASSALTALDQAAEEMLLHAAKQVREGTRPKAGHTDQGISAVQNWDVFATAALRVSSMPNLKPALRQAVLDLAGPFAALNLAHTQAELTEAEIDTIIDNCIGLTGYRHEPGCYNAADQALLALLKYHPMTPKQRLRTLVEHHDQVGFVVGQQANWANWIDLATVAELAAAPDLLTETVTAGNTVRRDEISKRLLLICLEKEIRTDLLNPRHFTEDSRDGKSRQEEERILTIRPEVDVAVIDALFALVPVSEVISSISYNHYHGARVLESIRTTLTKNLGKDQGRWEMFLSLLASWEGSLTELVDATLACTAGSTQEIPEPEASEEGSGLQLAF